MLRSFLESLGVHAAIFGVILAVAAIGMGNRPGDAMLIQISTSMFEHDPGPGDEMAGAQEPVAEPVQPMAAVKQTMKPKKLASAPKPTARTLEVPAPETALADNTLEDNSTVDDGDTLLAERSDENGEDAENTDVAYASSNGMEGYSGTGVGGGTGSGAPSGGGGDGGEGIFSLKDVDHRPKALKSAKPEYPRYAKENRIEGSVTVSFVLDKNGRVLDPKVVKSNPENVFEAAALSAVKKWEFSPAKKKGQAVRARMVVAVNFSLEEY